MMMMMVQWVTPAAHAVSSFASTTISNNWLTTSPPFPFHPPSYAVACHHHSNVDRRSFTLGLLVGAMPGLVVGRQSAIAAKRPPPPPPPTEKKDPNSSGIQAKVQASKKRKEAMKDAMAKERERGKPIVSNQPPS